MARKKLRKIRFESKRNRQGRRGPTERRAPTTSKTARSNPPAAAPAAAPQSAILTRQDIVSKLIPLSVPSAKDAQKNAHKTIDNVFSAMRHVLSEGDLTVADFGQFKAGKSVKTGDIQIRFTPDDKLKQAVDARLNAAT
jgi:nucleoid DNA-binding protein